jgi:predicted amidohydrolase
MKSAREKAADLIVFPALAISGRPRSVSEIDQSGITAALEKVKNFAARYGLFTIVGTAWKENEQMFNSAFVIDDQGKVLTRYDQLSADIKIFTPGAYTRPLWFNLKNVQGVVTIGSDIYWEEIAELSAWRGAQLLVNIANDDFGKSGENFKQSFAAFNTFSVFVNAAENPDRSSTGKSRVYDDLRRPDGKYHAEVILEADGNPGIYFVNGKMEKQNPWVSKMKYLNKSMIPWYNYGIAIIYNDQPDLSYRDE